MRMHKMEADELKAAHEFADAAELMLCWDKFSMNESYDSWKDMDDDDTDKIEILGIVKSICRDEGFSERHIDGRILAYEYLKRKYSYRNKVAVLTADILIEQVCDPLKTYLDLHPSYYQNHVEPEQ